MTGITQQLEPRNPGTPDDDVSPVRLEGRRAYRLSMGKVTNPPLTRQDQVEWWLGWYDERLRRFFGR